MPAGGTGSVRAESLRRRLVPSWSLWSDSSADCRPKGGQRSLREISAELAARGFINERGKAFSAASISSMLDKDPVSGALSVKSRRENLTFFLSRAEQSPPCARAIGDRKNITIQMTGRCQEGALAPS